MNKKKQTFSISGVIRVVLLFAIIILIFLLVIGIYDKKSFPMQHEKEIKKWEEIVERSCTIPCVSEIKEQDKLWGSMRDFKERELENLKSSKTSKYADKLIESIEEELNAKTKLYCRDEECSLSNPCKIDSTKCIIDKSNLSSIKDENPPSIFYYYGKIIEYVIGFISKNFVVFMFSVILIILSFILFEIHKLKNKNNIH